MKTASEAFTAGLYENSVKGVVWNGKLRVGIRSLNAEAIAAPVDYADARGTLDVIARIRAAMDVANDYLTGIDATPATRKEAVPVAVYNLNGVRTDGLQRGINLVRMSDNTVKKVLVK